MYEDRAMTMEKVMECVERDQTLNAGWTLPLSFHSMDPSIMSKCLLRLFADDMVDHVKDHWIRVDKPHVNLF